jgi:hypothetical protein
MTSSNTVPDTGADPETMTLEEVSRELAVYQPGTQASVVSTAEWLARRRQLWRRLDTLLARPGAATPQQRGAGDR